MSRCEAKSQKSSAYSNSRNFRRCNRLGSNESFAAKNRSSEMICPWKRSSTHRASRAMRRIDWDDTISR